MIDIDFVIEGGDGKDLKEELENSFKSIFKVINKDLFFYDIYNYGYVVGVDKEEVKSFREFIVVVDE